MSAYAGAKRSIKIIARGVNFFYGNQQALVDNNMEIARNRVTAIIGARGCGKSTHIRIYNRIYELYGEQRATGEILLDGKNILDPSYDLMELRRQVGMIFQKPTPFPMSILDNVAYGLKMHYRLGLGEMTDRVEEALTRAALWEEVKYHLSPVGDGPVRRPAATAGPRPGPGHGTGGIIDG